MTSTASRRDAAIVVTAKVVLGLIVLGGGFRAVSDDDFARVVHAQQWAAVPKLDPTGTSWLPLPFWILGLAMRVAGPSLTVARATSFVLGVGAAWLVWRAALLLCDDRRAALHGALLAACLPWSARLGVATVPEWPSAALVVFALATLARPLGKLRLWGALALGAACLSRYEGWTLVPFFVGVSLLDGWRSTRRGEALAASVIAGLAPLAWMLHNARAHGDPLHFLARVRAYKLALGGSGSALGGYPLSLLREEPELMLVTGALALAMAAGRLPWPSRFARPALGCGWLLAALTLAAIPGGAPTHHAGRALLAVWLLAAIHAGGAVTRLLGSASRHAVALGVLVLVLAGGLVLRPWYARLDRFEARADETAIGRAFASAAPAGARVFVESVDYGTFAMRAASGRPDDWVVDRSVDPRRAKQASRFASPELLRQAVATHGARFVVGQPSAATDALPAPITVAGRWRLHRVGH